MRRVGFLTTVLLLAVGLAATAQTPKTKTSKGKTQDTEHMVLLTQVSPLDLLVYEAVRKELKVTDEQQAKVNECFGKLDRFKQDSRQARQQLGEEPDPQVLATFDAQQRRARQQLERDLERATLRSLDGRQRKRLDQIGIRREGPRAFFRQDFQIRLNMSPGQIEAIKSIVTEGNQAKRKAEQLPPELMKKAVTRAGSGVFKVEPKYTDQLNAAQEKARQGGLKVRASMEQQIARLLSKKQIETYQSLIGEPFDLQTMQRAYVVPKSEGEKKGEAKER